MKKLSALSLVIVLVALVALSGQATSTMPVRAFQDATPAVGLPTEHPRIMAYLGEEIKADEAGTEGTLVGYCWPQSDPNQSECNYPANPDTIVAVALEIGTPIRFALTPDMPKPASFTLTRPDITGTDGKPVQVDLLAADGIFATTDLTEGKNAVQVIAVYPKTDESEYYIEYVFDLIASPATATATAEVVTSEASPSAATEQATLAVTEAISGATEVSTSAVVSTTAEATQAVTVVAANNTPLPTIVATTVVSTVGANTPIPATATPVPTLVPPTATPVSVTPTVVVVQPTIMPTESTAAAGVSPFESSIVVGGRQFEPIRVNFTYVDPSGRMETASRPNARSSYRILAAPSVTAQIHFGGPRPTALKVTLLSSDGTNVLDSQSLTPDNLALYIMPSRSGNYVLMIDVEYPNGKATYFYRLTIGG